MGTRTNRTAEVGFGLFLVLVKLCSAIFDDCIDFIPRSEREGVKTLIERPRKWLEPVFRLLPIHH